MNCKTCEYPLWNLAARQCPECGSPFKPSDYEFALNSVRFCCPDCRQPYYGTGDKGHLVPTDFACVRCGRGLQMDEMILLPTEGVQESQTKAEEMPWLVRAKIGRFKAWFATMGRAMADPGRLVELVPENRSAWEAIWYGVVTNMIFLVTNLGVFFLPGMLLPAMGRGGGKGLAIAGGIVAAAALLVLLPLMVILLWGALSHMILVATGGTRHPIARTYHAIGFSAGTNVLMAIPCMFFLSPIVLIWWVITAGIMLHRAQGTRAWRSVAAIAAPPALLVAAGIGLIAVSVASRAAAVRTAAVQARTAATAAATSAYGPRLVNLTAVGSSLVKIREQNGEWPGHGLFTMARGDALPHHFMGVESGTTLLVPDGTIESVGALGTERMTALADAMAASLPDGVVAHRVGDVVFTYHGVDPDAPASQGLWIAVEAPESAPETASIAVYYADGRSGLVVGAGWQAAVAEQNALRKVRGLAPLPDPRTVTLTGPATGP